MMRPQSETLVRRQFFISINQVKKLEEFSSILNVRSAAQIVRDAIDSYDPVAEKLQSQEQELLAIAHEKVKEALVKTEGTIKKVDGCLKNLSAKGAK